MKKKPGTVLHEMQKKAATGGECTKCHTQCETLSVDHIIPVSLLDAIGLRYEGVYNDAENYDLLCRRCNTIKGPRLDFDHPRTFALLEKYVALSRSLYGLQTKPTNQ